MPIAEINIMVKSQVNELGKIENITMNELFEMLQKKQSDFVEQEVKSALIYSQENGVDILGIGDAFLHQYPLKWKDMEKNWSSIFSKMKVKVNIQSYIMGSGTIREKLIESGERN